MLCEAQWTHCEDLSKLALMPSVADTALTHVLEAAECSFERFPLQLILPLCLQPARQGASAYGNDTLHRAAGKQRTGSG